MTKVYPVILTPVTIGKEQGFAAHVPDMEVDTQGSNLADAIAMAREAIGAKGICEQDTGRQIPEPSLTEPAHGADEIVTWVDIDFAKYRMANDMTTMRINVSVPKYLKVKGDEAGVNYSQALQEKLKELLAISR